MRLGTPLGDVRWIPFRNDSGSDMPGGACIAPNGIVIIEGQSVVSAQQPSTALYRRYLINGPVAVPNGSYGVCTFDTPAWAYYDNSNSPAANEGWGPKPSSWKLFKNYPGFTILGSFTNERVLVIGNEINFVRAKTDSSHAKSATGTISVYTAPGGSEVDTAMNLTAYNPYAAVGSGKWVSATWYAGQWILSDAEC